MDINGVIKALESIPGIHAVKVPDANVMNEIFSRELEIEDTSFGMPLDNRALKACRSRSAHLIIFCDYTFEPPTDHVMTMEDDNGKMVGFDIPPGKAEEYVDRDDLIWLSDNFALLPDGEASKVVMLPQEAKCIGETEGVSDPVIFYPVTTTDVYLRDLFGSFGDTPSIATALLSFNIL